jgi:hypothetical protein
MDNNNIFDVISKPFKEPILTNAIFPISHIFVKFSNKYVYVNISDKIVKKNPTKLFAIIYKPNLAYFTSILPKMAQNGY